MNQKRVRRSYYFYWINSSLNLVVGGELVGQYNNLCNVAKLDRFCSEKLKYLLSFACCKKLCLSKRDSLFL